MGASILLQYSQLLLFLFFTFLHSSSLLAASTSDTLNSSSSLTINDTLISAGQKFELGFFSFFNAGKTKWYAGIWYKDIPVRTIVWVANRDAPALTTTATLKLGTRANIMVLEQGKVLRWSSNQSRASHPVIQLLDDGNLVVREVFDESPERYIWQSFDHPSDTMLAAQKLGPNLKTGLDRYLTSWIGEDDPGSGLYTCRINPHGDPEEYLRKGNEIVGRSGPWVGVRWSGLPQMKPSSVLNFTLTVNQDEVSYIFQVLNSSVKSRLVVDSDGVVSRYTWVPDMGRWSVFWYQPYGQCEIFNLCGPFGFCNSSALFLCQCMQGFEPKNQQAWALRDGSDGCMRKTKVECDNTTDGFLVMENMKLPQSSGAFVNRSMSSMECKDMCIKNCSCTAYADSDFVNGVGSGCVIWAGDLIDLRSFPQGGQNLYVRLAASDLGRIGSFRNGSSNTRKVILGVMILFGISCIFVGAACFMWKRKRLVAEHKRKLGEEGINLLAIPGTAGFVLPVFVFEAVATATDNFSDKNKLGEGGFGCVYKGLLDDGREVAVKRLSQSSGQGTEQFKNELVLIAKLQHRNLVRLLGCCVHRDEKILIYEFLPNKSLDSFIFNSTKEGNLTWCTRFNIIEGIARGLLYLHRDSRLRVIHRDLKASNVLLDNDMNPKISDFGLARIFLTTQDSANTRLVVGTFGYMSPEYAMKGIFSEKSDVFSFGILLLEIISGKKNSNFCASDLYLNLPAYAWQLWNDGRGLELMDEVLTTEDDSYSEDQVLRCLKVGLLCVQNYASDRPTMSSVVLMLTSEAPLPLPKQPTFFPQTLSHNHQPTASLSTISITAIEGR